MRIGFDAKKIVTNLTGIGNYSRGIINALASCCDNHYLLFAPHKGEEACISRLHASQKIEFVYSPYKSALRQEWWRCRAMMKEIEKKRIDIYHGLSNELPRGIEKAGCKSVVTIHDLIFLRYPDTYNLLSRQILKAKTHHACHRADKIIAISQQTKQDIIDFYHIAEEKIEVIYQGCDSIFKHQVSSEVQQAIQKRYNIPSRYLLCVATFEPRKNHRSILQSMVLLDDDIHLVLVSKPTSYQQAIEEHICVLGLQKRVHILNRVPTCDLPPLYQGCSAFIYLSYFEGFGIPVLEAITSGVPVVAANGSCLEEAGGPGAFYCHPFDYQQVASCLSTVLNNPESLKPMIEAGKEYVTRFSDERIAGQLLSVYRQLLQPD